MPNLSIANINKFEIQKNPIQLERQVIPRTYCESVGRKAAILGYECGVFETWVYPFKIVSDLQFSVFVPEYKLTVNGTDIAKRIITRPELTTLIFSHDLFTIHQHLLAPLKEPGTIILLDVDTCTPIELWINFIPNLIPMWPAGLGGQYTQWLDELKAYYIGEGSKKYAGLIGSPFAEQLSDTPGHQLPDEPMKFVCRLSPEKARETYIPIILSGSVDGKDAAMQEYEYLTNSIPQLYEQNVSHYRRLRSEFMNIKTPEPNLDLALEWAKVSLDKGLAENPQLGTGLVAGYGVSGKTHRPGFAWFFGGDTCINSMAINGYGDFATIKKALTLLRDRQRADGKIFHELTQSAALLNWFEDYPYGFYHADTTAYYIIAIYDYFLRSGDENFISHSWESIQKAYRFCLSADEDGDGLMENSAAGLAAMEVGEMLKQNRVDIFLATLWLQALRCMIELSEFFKEKELNQECQQQFEKGHQSFRKIFINEKEKTLNFALLTDGTKHSDTTVWHSLPLAFYLVEAVTVLNTIHHLASSEMSSDWGVRGVSQKNKYYSPIHYNNGSVWAFTTTFVAIAWYRQHRQINGWHNLMANANMTYLDALGWQTELLSGEYYRPVSTSVPHQLFSASGIVNPLIMGLLGLESNASSNVIRFSPHLPIDWNELKVNNYRCGKDSFDFSLQRTENNLKLEIKKTGSNFYHFFFAPAFALATKIDEVLVNGLCKDYSIQNNQYDIHCEIECDLKNKLTIEINCQLGMEFAIPLPEIKIGSRSHGLKLIDYKLTDDLLTLIIEGVGDRDYKIPLKTRFRINRVEGGTIRKIDGLNWELTVNFDKKISNNFGTKEVKIHITETR